MFHTFNHTWFHNLAYGGVKAVGSVIVLICVAKKHPPERKKFEAAARSIKHPGVGAASKIITIRIVLLLSTTELP